MLFKQVMTTSFGVGDHRGHNSFSGWTIFGMLRLLSYRQGKVGGGGGGCAGISCDLFWYCLFAARAARGSADKFRVALAKGLLSNRRNLIGYPEPSFMGTSQTSEVLKTSEVFFYRVRRAIDGFPREVYRTKFNCTAEAGCGWLRRA